MKVQGLVERQIGKDVEAQALPGCVLIPVDCANFRLGRIRLTFLWNVIETKLKSYLF